MDILYYSNNCKHCQKELSNRHSLWRHENKVCKKNSDLSKNIININENNDSNISVIQNQTNININFISLENQNVLELKEE